MEIKILMTLMQGTEEVAERAPDVRGTQAEKDVLLSASGPGPANSIDATKDVPVYARHTPDWRTESLLHQEPSRKKGGNPNPLCQALGINREVPCAALTIFIGVLCTPAMSSPGIQRRWGWGRGLGERAEWGLHHCC